MAQKIIWKGALWRGSPARHACNHVTRLINPVCCGSGKTDRHSMGLPLSYTGSPTLRNTSWTPARRFKTLHIRPCVHYMMAVCRKAVLLLLPSATYPLQDQHDIPLVTFICKCLTIQYCLGKVCRRTTSLLHVRVSRACNGRGPRSLLQAHRLLALAPCQSY